MLATGAREGLYALTRTALYHGPLNKWLI